MGAYKERCSRKSPCIFCGDVGLDMRMHYPETDEVIHWCHKMRAQKGEHVIANNGIEYKCIASGKRTKESTMGEFCLFKEYLSYDQYCEKRSREDPDWRSKAHNRPKEIAARTYRADQVFENTEVEILPGEAKVLTPEELDQRYRFFLDSLVLEDWHRRSLLAEWKGEVNDVSYLLDQYPIRSLPPSDQERFSEFGKKVRYKNPTRKQIVSKLFEKFGGRLAGMPGLYERQGDYFADKPEAERWTIAVRGGAIIFPSYNKDGLIYRLRLKVDHPDLVIKEKNGYKPYRGSYGYFTWQPDKEGLKCWYVPESDYAKKIEVPDKDAYGKPRGKYINFSSFYEQEVNGEVRNALHNGSRSGSPYSLYGRNRGDESLVILTEGEKKAMVAAELCGCLAVDIPGVSNYGVIFKKEEGGKSLFEHLIENGAETFILCYDADKEVNPDVLKNEQRLAQELKGRGVCVLIGTWSSKYDKGLDDLLILGIRPTVKEYK